MVGGFGAACSCNGARPNTFAGIGTMEQTLPRLHKGFCPVLAPIVGGEDEFAESWRVLKSEAEIAAQWLGVEVEGPIGADVASAGQGYTPGNLRANLVEHRERINGRILEEALNQAARPMFSCPEREVFQPMAQDSLDSLESFSPYLMLMFKTSTVTVTAHALLEIVHSELLAHRGNRGGGGEKYWQTFGATFFWKEGPLRSRDEAM